MSLLGVSWVSPGCVSWVRVLGVCHVGGPGEVLDVSLACHGYVLGGFVPYRQKRNPGQAWRQPAQPEGVPDLAWRDTDLPGLAKACPSQKMNSSGLAGNAAYLVPREEGLPRLGDELPKPEK